MPSPYSRCWRGVLLNSDRAFEVNLVALSEIMVRGGPNGATISSSRKSITSFVVDLGVAFALDQPVTCSTPTNINQFFRTVVGKGATKSIEKEWNKPVEGYRIVIRYVGILFADWHPSQLLTYTATIWYTFTNSVRTRISWYYLCLSVQCRHEKFLRSAVGFLLLVSLEALFSTFERACCSTPYSS